MTVARILFYKTYEKRVQAVAQTLLSPTAYAKVIKLPRVWKTVPTRINYIRMPSDAVVAPEGISITVKRQKPMP